LSSRRLSNRFRSSPPLSLVLLLLRPFYNHVFLLPLVLLAPLVLPSLLLLLLRPFYARPPACHRPPAHSRVLLLVIVLPLIIVLPPPPLVLPLIVLLRSSSCRSVLSTLVHRLLLAIPLVILLLHSSSCICPPAFVLLRSSSLHRSSSHSAYTYRSFSFCFFLVLSPQLVLLSLVYFSLLLLLLCPRQNQGKYLPSEVSKCSSPVG